MKKVLIIPVIAFTLLGVVAFGTTQALADDNGVRTSLVQKVAEKFNLNQSDVQAVFDEVHTEHQAQMETNYEDMLQKAVDNGEITSEQKDLLIAKHEELQTAREQNRDNFQNLTPEERRTQMQEEKADLQSWADQNGIDLKYLMEFRHGPGFGGRMMHEGF